MTFRMTWWMGSNGIYEYALSSRDVLHAEKLNKIYLKLGLGVTSQREVGSVKEYQIVTFPAVCHRLEQQMLCASPNWSHFAPGHKLGCPPKQGVTLFLRAAQWNEGGPGICHCSACPTKMSYF